MMEKLMARGGEIAREARQGALRNVAVEVRNVLRSAAIEVDEARILVTGRGIVARWFIEPRLRFLGRGSK